MTPELKGVRPSVAVGLAFSVAAAAPFELQLEIITDPNVKSFPNLNLGQSSIYRLRNISV